MPFAFYARRDTQPSRRRFDDLPKAYRANVDRQPPFGQKPGGRPALTEAEIRDVVAFLRTLTDGYKAP